MIAFLVVMLIVLAIYSYSTRLKLSAAMKMSKHQYKNSQFWYEKWKESTKEFVESTLDYIKLEEGSDELETNYQQEILSLHDQLEVIANAAEYWKVIAEELEKIRLDHDVNCLPVLGKDFYPAAEEDDTPLFDSTPG